LQLLFQDSCLQEGRTLTVEMPLTVSRVFVFPDTPPIAYRARNRSQWVFDKLVHGPAESNRNGTRIIYTRGISKRERTQQIFSALTRFAETKRRTTKKIGNLSNYL
jgi:hypothetical protein